MSTRDYLIRMVADRLGLAKAYKLDSPVAAQAAEETRRIAAWSRTGSSYNG